MRPGMQTVACDEMHPHKLLFDASCDAQATPAAARKRRTETPPRAWYFGAESVNSRIVDVFGGHRTALPLLWCESGSN